APTRCVRCVYRGRGSGRRRRTASRSRRRPERRPRRRWMSLTGRLSATGRTTIHERLVTEVGGYLHNVVRESHVTCAVCVTPIKPAFDVCLRCQRDRREFGDALADLVVPLCYGIRGRQSGYLMYSYNG